MPPAGERGEADKPGGGLPAQPGTGAGAAAEAGKSARMAPRLRPAPDPGPTTFLARRAYRRRRLLDAARLMPAFGTALFLLPVLWISVESPGDTATGFVYVFAVWLLLIVLGAVIARRISDPVRVGGAEDAHDPDDAA